MYIQGICICKGVIMHLLKVKRCLRQLSLSTYLGIGNPYNPLFSFSQHWLHGAYGLSFTSGIHIGLSKSHWLQFNFNIGNGSIANLHIGICNNLPWHYGYKGYKGINKGIYLTLYKYKGRLLAHMQNWFITAC